MNGPVPIRLLSPTSYPRRVYKNTLAALCEPVDSNQVDGEPWFRNAQKAETEVRVARHCQPKECAYQEQGQQRSLPLELEELLHRSTDGLNDEQIGVLTDLLNEYQDVFVTTTNLFGCTSITQHKIITGESKPTKQAPRRLRLQLSRHRVHGLLPQSW